MSYFTTGRTEIYFEESGSGEPIIAIHGLLLNTRYWEKVAPSLSRSFRLISMDMRGHGRTRAKGSPPGYDEETIGGDIMALADHLKLRRFHVVAHSTGGFAAVRQAMRDSSRFATLILTGTASVTSPFPVPKEILSAANDMFARSFEAADWDQIVAAIRVQPRPFFQGIMESDRAEELLKFSREVFGLGDPSTIAQFIRTFFQDPDPKVEQLRKIACPTLVIVGEKDEVMLPHSKLMASEIPGAKYLEYPGVGHMTAIEVPERLAADVASFVAAHPSG